MGGLMGKPETLPRVLRRSLKVDRFGEGKVVREKLVKAVMAYLRTRH
jgi:hypothetical protein